MTHALTLSTEMMTTLNTRGLPIAAVIAVKFAVCVTKWGQNRRTRLHLAELDPHLLKDLGLTQEQARTEAARVFWKS
ncbi:MAG: DUF1127 domain-containing protein [Sulfitobacter sp.]